MMHFGLGTLAPKAVSCGESLRMPQAILGTVFTTLGAVFILINARAFFSTHVLKQFVSSVPLLGALFGTMGLLQLPQTRKWAWIPILLDYGTIRLLLSVPKIAKELWDTSRFNLVKELVSKEEKRTVTLRLYKSGAFVIEYAFKLDPDEQGLLGKSDLGIWRQGEGIISLTLGSDRIELVQWGPVWKAEDEFSTYEANEALKMAGVEFTESAS